MNTLTCDSEQGGRRNLRRLALVLAEIFARFFGLGVVAHGDSSRHLFARLFLHE